MGYSKAVESHQKLTDLMNDPKVRVASGDQASHILQAVSENKEAVEEGTNELEIKADENRVKLFQKLYQDHALKEMIQPKIAKQPQFNYTLCESPADESHLNGPSQPVFSALQVQQLLAKQKQEFELSMMRA